jgi:hypothetical protein
VPRQFLAPQQFLALLSASPVLSVSSALSPALVLSPSPAQSPSLVLSSAPLLSHSLILSTSQVLSDSSVLSPFQCSILNVSQPLWIYEAKTQIVLTIAQKMLLLCRSLTLLSFNASVNNMFSSDKACEDRHVDRSEMLPVLLVLSVLLSTGKLL